MKVKIPLILGVSMLVFFQCSLEKKAKKSFDRGRYQTAINQYEKLLEDNPDRGKYNYQVAEAYRLSNRLEEAEPYYAKAGGAGVNKDSIKLLHAEALKTSGKYAEARAELMALSKNASDEQMRDLALAQISGLDYLEKLNSTENYYSVKNLELINTPQGEYSPVYLNNELYFTASRDHGGKVYEATGTPYTDIYKMATRGANVDITTLEPLPEPLNEPMRNEGCITFTPDGKIMVFAKGNTNKKNQGADVDLYLSRFRNGAWTDPIKVNPPVNTKYSNEADSIAKNYSWDSTPAFGPDGRTFYFASNRQKGYGGTDIYQAQMDSRGRFRRIQNMGPEINTAGNEMFPYVSDDGRFFFASDGHPGYGGLDLFVVARKNGKDVVENLGKPMNSTGDDFGIYLFKADRGFFTSNRKGGKGGDDIYTFVNEDPDLKVINYYLQGITYFKGDNNERNVLPNTTVKLLDEEGDVMQDYVTGNDGKFLFKVYANENYHLVAESEGYITTRTPYTTEGKSVDPSTLKDLVTNITFDTLMVLDRKAVGISFVLDNIYFAFASADINEKAGKELDKLAQILKDNPEIKIEMGSHTDSVDTEAYNIKLSQRRAESTVQYLIRKGISPDRLKAKGYGESQPIARNTNPDGTDNPEGRARNRRTEFKILEIGAIPQVSSDDGEDQAGQTQEDDFDEDKYFRD